MGAEHGTLKYFSETGSVVSKACPHHQKINISSSVLRGRKATSSQMQNSFNKQHRSPVSSLAVIVVPQRTNSVNHPSRETRTNTSGGLRKTRISQLVMEKVYLLMNLMITVVGKSQ